MSNDKPVFIHTLQLEIDELRAQAKLLPLAGSEAAYWSAPIGSKSR
jgi:hypothetical protein